MLENEPEGGERTGAEPAGTTADSAATASGSADTTASARTEGASSGSADGATAEGVATGEAGATVEGGTTAEGIHLGAMASTVDLVTRCYTGLEIRHGVLHLDPELPSEIDSLSFVLPYQGHWGIRLSFHRNEVRITGSLGDGVERLEIGDGGDTLVVRARYPRNNRNSRNSEPTTLVLEIPRQASLDVESVAASVDVQGVAGDELEIDSVSGRRSLNFVPRPSSVSAR